MVGGTVAIEAIEADKTQPVYNLDVADNRDFFVGTKGLLVHDFSFVQPVLEPFDRQPSLGAAMPPHPDVHTSQWRLWRLVPVPRLALVRLTS